jgi:hypothetical protein
MRILELFSGTHSLGKVTNPSDEVISLDILGNPTICMDIREWNYKIYPVGYFDYIHGSPPCTFYSKANSRIKFVDRDFKLGDSLVLKTLEIIEYFRPFAWTLENPRTGYLSRRPFMQGLSYTDVDYCKYGSPMRKQTRIWNNINLQLQLCNHHDCEASHIGPKGYMIHSENNWGSGNRAQKASQRAIIPEKLCVSILEQVKNKYFYE